jgi:hypothetical protein
VSLVCVNDSSECESVMFKWHMLTTHCYLRSLANFRCDALFKVLEQYDSTVSPVVGPVGNGKPVSCTKR